MMGIKNGLIYLLGGYTERDYKDQFELLDKAIKGWQSSEDTHKEIEQKYKEMNERLMKEVTETSEKYVTILRFIGNTFGNPIKSKDDILSACKEMLESLDDKEGNTHNANTVQERNN